LSSSPRAQNLTAAMTPQMLVSKSSTLGTLQAGLPILAIDAEGPAASTRGRIVAFASDLAGRVIELLGADQLVSTVALATIFRPGKSKASRFTVSYALLVGHWPQIGTNGAIESAVVVVFETTSISEASRSIVRFGTRLVGSSWRRCCHRNRLVDGDCLGTAGRRLRRQSRWNTTRF
jgi:hypothetical protein